MKKPLKEEYKMVLLIEDNPSWITLIRYSLPMSMKLEYVVTLQEGLQKDLSHYDVVLLDLILPDSPNPMESFLRIFQEIRIIRKLILPILIISGQDDDCIRREILDYGVSGYIDKGKWDRQYLIETILKAMSENPTQSYDRQYQSMIHLFNDLPLLDIVKLGGFFV